MWPETLDIASAVRVVGWAANWNFRVTDHGAAVESGRTTGASVAAERRALSARAVVGLERPTVVNYVASWCWGWSCGWKGRNLNSTGVDTAISIVILDTRSRTFGEGGRVGTLTNGILTKILVPVSVLIW